MKIEEEARVPKKVKGISLRLILAALIFLASIGIFALIADEIVLENENGLDLWAFRKLNGYTNPILTSVMLNITFFGSSYFLMPAYFILIIYFLVFKKEKGISLDVASFSILSTIIL